MSFNTSYLNWESNTKKKKENKNIFPIRNYMEQVWIIFQEYLIKYLLKYRYPYHDLQMCDGGTNTENGTKGLVQKIPVILSVNLGMPWIL